MARLLLEPRRSFDLRRSVADFRFSVVSLMELAGTSTAVRLVLPCFLRAADRRLVSSRFSIRVIKSGGSGSRFGIFYSFVWITDPDFGIGPVVWSGPCADTGLVFDSGSGARICE